MVAGWLWGLFGFRVIMAGPAPTKVVGRVVTEEVASIERPIRATLIYAGD